MVAGVDIDARRHAYAALTQHPDLEQHLFEDLLLIHAVSHYEKYLPGNAVTNTSVVHCPNTLENGLVCDHPAVSSVRNTVCGKPCWFAAR